MECIMYFIQILPSPPFSKEGNSTIRTCVDTYVSNNEILSSVEDVGQCQKCLRIRSRIF